MLYDFNCNTPGSITRERSEIQVPKKTFNTCLCRSLCLSHSLLLSSPFPSLSFHSPPSYLCFFSILLCSNFPFSSQPARLWRLITIFARHFFSFSFPHLLSYFWQPTSTPPPPSTSPTPPFLFLFSPPSHSFPAIFRARHLGRLVSFNVPR